MILVLDDLATRQIAAFSWPPRSIDRRMSQSHGLGLFLQREAMPCAPEHHPIETDLKSERVAVQHVVGASGCTYMFARGK